jgi:surfeit locus 1 family protein
MATTKEPTPAPETPPVPETPASARVSLMSRIKPRFSRIKPWIARRYFAFLPSVIAVTATVILLGLGTWQLVRLHMKNTLIQTITRQLRDGETDYRLHPPTAIDNWQPLDYHAIVVQGEWLDMHDMHLLPRTYEGQNGYHLLTPLRLAHGQILLVNRGWVPDKTNIGVQSQNGLTVVAGIVREAPDEKPFGMMDNTMHEIARNEWAWPDITAMREAIGMGDVMPVILYAERSETAAKDDFPIGGQAQLSIRNEHRNYAFTWYSLALVLLVVWLVAAQKKTVVVVETKDNERD